MAQTRTAKGTAASKVTGTTLTVPDVSMTGGDEIVIVFAWDITAHGSAPTSVKYGNNTISNFVVGETIIAKWRVRMYSEIINNTRTADVVVTFPTSSAAARVMFVSSLHSAGKTLYDDSAEHLANTISTSGANEPIKHIQTILAAAHVSNGPSSDNTGTSSTGMTLGQRVGTTGDADTTNITIQERYKIITASTVAAGSFVIGDSYQIKTIGTTDFTAIGAASNTIGVQFVSTGVGSGTGDAYDLEDGRSRLTGLTSRDHMGIIAFYQPKYSFSISQMVQYHRNVNENPDWVQVLVEDDNGNGFWVPIDPDDFDDWSDAVVDERLAKYVSIWVTNHVDNNLAYEADTARDIRMATFVDKEIIV